MNFPEYTENIKHKAYPKIPAYGYDGTEDILNGNIVITPKIDGSNVAVWCFGGKYKLARRNDWLSENDKGFAPLLNWFGDESVTNAYLATLGSPERPVVLFGEFAYNQNKLKYTLKLPIILFDIASYQKGEDGEGHLDFKNHEQLSRVAASLCWPFVPSLYSGDGTQLKDADTIIERYLGQISILGGAVEEGVVIKGYGRRTRFDRNYFCKLVTAEFKESRDVVRKSPRANMGIGEWAAERFFTPARLQKAIQKMQEDGSWDEGNSRKNIGKLIGVVMKDINEEHKDEIVEQATKIAWKEVGTQVSRLVAPTLDKLMEDSNGTEQG